MTKRPFYASLAWTNIKNNRKFYIPYILTGVGTVAMLYIILFIRFDNAMSAMYGGNILGVFLGFGAIIIGIFSTIFLFYTNSFLMKRRKKELGLFTVLGMEKRHLARIQLYETLIVSFFSIVIGLAVGILFSKLVLLFLGKLVHFDIKFGFSISWLAALVSAIVFAAIFVLTYISNLVRIGRLKPVELLYGGNMGQKEPKTKWLLTIIGVLCLAGGYAIAVLTKSPLDAIFLFFVAVVLVIIGTYCLFTSGSITVLKLMRRNKRYYYKTKHFTSVSGMLYRMRQNAVGLGNICILSTMVLVMLSTTIALNAGIKDVLDGRYTSEVVFSFEGLTEDAQGRFVTNATTEMPRTLDIAEERVRSVAQEQGREITKLSSYMSLSFAVMTEDGAFITNRDDNYYNNPTVSELSIVTAEQYSKLTGTNIELKPGEVLLFESKNSQSVGERFTLFDTPYTAVGRIDSFPVTGESNVWLVDLYGMVVDSNETLAEILNAEFEAYESPNYIQGFLQIDMDGTEQEKIDCYNAMFDELSDAQIPNGDPDAQPIYNTLSGECRAEMASQVYSLYGGLLFVGIFLGILFLMATILIMYYKQVTEGYDDKERFYIMQQVGMSHSEIKATIRSQVLTVFFLPLATACLHIVFAFSIITKLLALLNLTNVTLFVWCTVGTVLAFALIYAVVYAVTARVYYKIIEMKA